MSDCKACESGPVESTYQDYCNACRDRERQNPAADIHCPYCREPYDDTDDENHEEDEDYEVECSECEETFTYSFYFIKSYNESKKIPLCRKIDVDCVWVLIKSVDRPSDDLFYKCKHCSEHKFMNKAEALKIGLDIT
jgi:hypothetical protein